MKYHRGFISTWGIKRIIIDEYHNIISEIFRFGYSWDSLRNLASLQAKIVCMSATANQFIMNCASRLLSMGDNCRVIGSTSTYRVPNVAITVSAINYSELVKKVVAQ
eukprot:scaffold21180_cov78-Skeletonema_dohrnii-CCMP3373.AAC.1